MLNKNFFKILAEMYPSAEATQSEIINLEAILDLPKGTEHFISDIHGEYELFNHILNNCSGVIREKVSILFGDRYDEAQLSNICTLVYYPKEKLNKLKSLGLINSKWYKNTLSDLVELAKLLSAKYSRSYVKKAIDGEFGFVIDELMHARAEQGSDKDIYHAKMVKTIIATASSDQVIVDICKLIKRLAVDRLHIVGDIFDRGAHAERVMDILMDYHALDITWGNHDILWMGAGRGSEVCIASVLRINIAQGNFSILESGYGISLRELSSFAERVYKPNDTISQIVKAISVILFKLEGQAIMRHSDFQMEQRLLLGSADLANGKITLDGQTYSLKTRDFPTVDPSNPYELNDDEKTLMRHLKKAFLNSTQLARHIKFLYEKGSIYRIYNGNLIYHGCIPMTEQGEFDTVTFNGIAYSGKKYLDFADQTARNWQIDPDFLWYLWCGGKSPLSGRTIKTFERTYIEDKSAWVEEKNPYYRCYANEDICRSILAEFGLNSPISHIINGHTPVIVKKGENPVKANGKLLVIDGGFCKAYNSVTGIAGYTLISNSHGLRIKAHRPFENIDKVLADNSDIKFTLSDVSQFPHRQLIKHTDGGREISAKLTFLYQLLDDYRMGKI